MSPGSSDRKEFASNVGDLGLIPGSGRYPEEGDGNPLQYSCLENPMDGGAWQATYHGVTKSRTRLSDFTLTFQHNFPVGSDGKESACYAGSPGLIPGSGRSPGEGNGNSLKYSCLENSMDRKPGRLQSMGLQRVGHNWVTNTFTFFNITHIILTIFRCIVLWYTWH